LRERCRNRINNNGFLVIDARKYRTQKRNLRDAIDRLVMLIKKAEKEPKIRKQTGATKASKEKRLRIKRSRSEIKDLRKSVDPFSDNN
jgi:ribosome-associated protein